MIKLFDTALIDSVFSEVNNKFSYPCQPLESSELSLCRLHTISTWNISKCVTIIFITDSIAPLISTAEAYSGGGITRSGLLS